jgi:hypothetical protein
VPERRCSARPRKSRPSCRPPPARSRRRCADHQHRAPDGARQRHHRGLQENFLKVGAFAGYSGRFRLPLPSKQKPWSYATHRHKGASVARLIPGRCIFPPAFSGRGSVSCHPYAARGSEQNGQRHHRRNRAIRRPSLCRPTEARSGPCVRRGRAIRARARTASNETSVRSR